MTKANTEAEEPQIFINSIYSEECGHRHALVQKLTKNRYISQRDPYNFVGLDGVMKSFDELEQGLTLYVSSTRIPLELPRSGGPIDNSIKTCSPEDPLFSIASKFNINPMNSSHNFIAKIKRKLAIFYEYAPKTGEQILPNPADVRLNSKSKLTTASVTSPVGDIDSSSHHYSKNPVVEEFSFDEKDAELKKALESQIGLPEFDNSMVLTPEQVSYMKKVYVEPLLSKGKQYEPVYIDLTLGHFYDTVACGMLYLDLQDENIHSFYKIEEVHDPESPIDLVVCFCNKMTDELRNASHLEFLANYCCREIAKRRVVSNYTPSTGMIMVESNPHFVFNYLNFEFRKQLSLMDIKLVKMPYATAHILKPINLIRYFYSLKKEVRCGYSVVHHAGTEKSPATEAAKQAMTEIKRLFSKILPAEFHAMHKERQEILLKNIGVVARTLLNIHSIGINVNHEGWISEYELMEYGVGQQIYAEYFNDSLPTTFTEADYTHLCKHFLTHGELDIDLINSRVSSFKPFDMQASRYSLLKGRFCIINNTNFLRNLFTHVMQFGSPKTIETYLKYLSYGNIYYDLIKNATEDGLFEIEDLIEELRLKTGAQVDSDYEYYLTVLKEMKGYSVSAYHEKAILKKLHEQKQQLYDALDQKNKIATFKTACLFFHNKFSPEKDQMTNDAMLARENIYYKFDTAYDPNTPSTMSRTEAYEFNHFLYPVKNGLTFEDKNATAPKVKLSTENINSILSQKPTVFSIHNKHPNGKSPQYFCGPLKGTFQEPPERLTF